METLRPPPIRISSARSYDDAVLHKRVLDAAEVPPGYPRELETTSTLQDGRVVSIRPLAPCDWEGLAWEIANADSETLHLRFFTRVIKARPEFIDALVDLDYSERLALVALGENGEGAGVARYAATSEPGEAQVAVVVNPGWRRSGLASLLLDRLQEAARSRGIVRMMAVYLSENEAVESLRVSRGIGEPRIRRGLAEISWAVEAHDPALG